MTPKAKEDITFETLEWPQHFHVGIHVFEKLDDHDNFQWGTHYDLVEYNVGVAIERAKANAVAADPERTRERTHINQVTQCSEVTHTKAIPHPEKAKAAKRLS
jgi:hypothetical protein